MYTDGKFETPEVPNFKGHTLYRHRLISDALAYSQRESTSYNQSNRLLTREDYFEDILYSTAEGIGEKRFILFEKIMEYGFNKGHDWTRSISQREYHNLVSSALRKTLLEDDYLRVGNSIAIARKWPTYNQKVLCRAPRRFGKSVAVAMMVASLAESIATYPLKKPYRISVFSTGGRISEEMAKYVIDFLTIRGCQFHKSQKFNVKIEMKAKGDNNRNSPVEIDFYPANPKISVNSDLLIVDEAAHIDINLWNDVISPILGMESTVLTMISSPLGHGNFFSRLLNLEFESGEKVFISYAPDLICRRCRASGSKEIMKKCGHKMYLLPRWKSESKMESIETILADEIEIHMRENLGEIVERGGSHFTETILDNFMSTPPVYPDNPGVYPSFVLVMIDPNVSDNSTSSEMAICAMARFESSIAVSFFFFFFFF